MIGYSAVLHILDDPNGIKSIFNYVNDGDTIILKDDIEYSAFTLYGKVFGPKGVTLRAVNENGATITGNSTIMHSSGIKIENLHFRSKEPDSYTTLSEADGPGWLLDLKESSDITISKSTFEGHNVTKEFVYAASDGYEEKLFQPDPLAPSDESETLFSGYEVYAGKGLMLRGSTDISISDNSFETLRFGVAFETSSIVSDSVSIKRNHFNGIREDAIRGTNHNGTTVNENVFENFLPFAEDRENPADGLHDHGDMIQFWGWGDGNGQAFGVSDFTVARNFMFDDVGSTQAFFGHMKHLDDDKRAGVQYTDFSVKDNLIVTGSIHGISLGSVEGGVISGNTLLPNIHGILEGWFPRINLTSSESSWRNDDPDLVRYTTDFEIFDNYVGADTNSGSDEEGLFYLENLLDTFEIMGISDGTGQIGSDNQVFSLDENSPLYLGDENRFPNLFDDVTVYNDVYNVGESFDSIGGSSLINVSDIIMELLGGESDSLLTLSNTILPACIDFVIGQNISDMGGTPTFEPALNNFLVEVDYQNNDGPIISFDSHFGGSFAQNGISDMFML